MRRLRLILLGIATMVVLSAWAAEVPNTLTDAFLALDQLLSVEEREAFKATPEREAVVSRHFGLGMYIRNEWLRSKAGRASALPRTLRDLGALSLDDASSMVLTSYWRHLNGKPIEIEKQGACYRRWWTEMKRIEDDAQAKRENPYPEPTFSCP